jgi:hypothetical protein
MLIQNARAEYRQNAAVSMQGKETGFSVSSAKRRWCLVRSEESWRDGGMLPPLAPLIRYKKNRTTEKIPLLGTYPRRTSGGAEDDGQKVLTEQVIKRRKD